MHELSFKFIGNVYLKLRVSWEMMFMNPYSVNLPASSAAAPEIFEVVSIQRNWEKEKAEQ